MNEPKTSRPALPLAHLILMAGPRGLGRLRQRARADSKVQCSECGCDIPPGRAGRRCKPCRGTS